MEINTTNICIILKSGKSEKCISQQNAKEWTHSGQKVNKVNKVNLEKG